MKNAVAAAIRRFLANWRRARQAKPSDMHVAIMRVHRVQTWFLEHRGVPMVVKECGPCGKERMFTIWSDGKYYCLACLYAQVSRKRPEPIPMKTGEDAMWEFSSSWLAYRKRVEAYEDPWRPSSSAIIKLSRIARLRAPPICEVGACEVCGGLRPVMRRVDGDAGCIYCLMRGRIVEFEIEVANETVAA